MAKAPEPMFDRDGPRRRTDAPSVRCPNCGSGRSRPIAYGFPGSDMTDAFERGEVALGGCVIHDNSPSRRCRDCGFGWGRLGEEFSEADD